MPKNKPDKFLQAIQKYAKSQKTAMQGEVKQLKTERLKVAQDKAKRDSQRLIREKLQESRNRLTSALATKTQEGQKKLFVQRSEMVDQIFSDTKDKLMDYTRTEEYADKLIKSAEEIAALFDGHGCVLSVNERDIARAEQIKNCFSADVQVVSDPSVRIGGIKGYCKSLGIIADETLDSKLYAQREWFVENADLRVL